MKTLAAVLTLLPFSAFAAPAPTQITGQLVEITDNTVVIAKGREHLTFARDTATKLPERLKAGSKVTVEYSMMAVSVSEKKDEPAPSSGQQGKESSKDKAQDSTIKMK